MPAVAYLVPKDSNTAENQQTWVMRVIVLKMLIFVKMGLTSMPDTRIA
jgi:hypothetical protein